MTLQQRQPFDGDEKDTMTFVDDNGDVETARRDDFWFSPVSRPSIQRGKLHSD